MVSPVSAGPSHGMTDLEHHSLSPEGMTGQRDSVSSETETSSEEEEDSLLYHMEKKYLEPQEVDSFINIFGTSPCQLASKRHLELLVLNRMSIASVGDEKRLASLVRAVSDVDLAFNKISDWKVIQTLLNCMPHLRRLNLSHNPLAWTPTAELPECSCLTTLFLNGVNLPFDSLSLLTSKMPLLQELHLNTNHEYANTRNSLPPISEKVTILQLNACNFNDWNAVLNVLTAFPNTQRLFLSDNPLGNVENDTTRQVMARVRFLSLNQCAVGDWRAVENLQLVENLEELKILNNPLFSNLSEEERFHLTIGRLPKLKSLNGSPIGEVQREDSERFFIRYYQDAENKPAIFEKLVSVHGNLEALVKVDFTPQRNALVFLRCEEKDLCIRLRMRLNKTVMDLMRYASKMTGISVPRMRLFYQHSEACGPTELRFPNRLLSHLHIEDGDEFVIQSKILPPEKSVLW